MAHRKLSTSLVVADIRSGMHDNALMAKYGLSPAGLKTLLQRLIDVGAIDHSEIAKRIHLSTATMEIMHRSTGDVLFSGSFPDLKSAVVEAVRSKESLAGAILTRAQLQEANLEGAYLPRADLRGADLEGSNLVGADLCRADLSNANLRRAIMQGADLTDAELLQADLSGADLMNVNLTGARLVRANLVKSNLANVDFTGADLTDADLSHCNLDGGVLTEATMDNARVEGVNFTRVIKDKVAIEKAKKRARVDQFVFQPGSFILAQILFCIVQLVGLALFGPFMLFWFAGVMMINLYFAFFKSRWWWLGILIQIVFCALVWRIVGVMLGKLDSVF